MSSEEIVLIAALSAGPGITDESYPTPPPLGNRMNLHDAITTWSKAAVVRAMAPGVSRATLDRYLAGRPVEDSTQRLIEDYELGGHIHCVQVPGGWWAIRARHVTPVVRDTLHRLDYFVGISSDVIEAVKIARAHDVASSLDEIHERTPPGCRLEWSEARRTWRCVPYRDGAKK